MGSYSWVSIISLLGCLILACSALASHQLNWRKGITLAFTWAAIFAAVTLIINAVKG